MYMASCVRIPLFPTFCSINGILQRLFVSIFGIGELKFVGAVANRTKCNCRGVEIWASIGDIQNDRARRKNNLDAEACKLISANTFIMATC